MAKKRKLIKKIKPYIGYAIAVCALLAILSLLLTGVVLVPPTESMEKISISGFTAIFGWSTEIERMGIKVVTEYTTFSFMGLLVLVFSILGAVASLINNKTLNIISILLFVAGAIFVFLLKIDFVNAGTDALKLYINDTALTYKANLGIGAILSGVFSIVGALFGAVKVYLK